MLPRLRERGQSQRLIEEKIGRLEVKISDDPAIFCFASFQIASKNLFLGVARSVFPTQRPTQVVGVLI
jgi:hypothetical protein